MSFFKKTLATLGIGNAKIDAIIAHEALYPGQVVDITIHVYGGGCAQEIDNIDLALCCHYIAEVARNHDNHPHSGGAKQRIKKKHILNSWSLPYAFVINPGEERNFQCQLHLPWNTPITIGESKVWLETSLDIAMAADPKDSDSLTVRPEPVLENVISAFEEQGLRIRQVECEEVSGFESPFIQEFEFVPVDGRFHGEWRELEMIAYRDEHCLQLWFEIDRQKHGVGGMVAALLGKGKLQRKLTLPLPMNAEDAGAQVLDYLIQSSQRQ